MWTSGSTRVEINIRIPPHRYCTSVPTPSMPSHNTSHKLTQNAQCYDNIRISGYRKGTTATVPPPSMPSNKHPQNDPKSKQYQDTTTSASMYHRPVCLPKLTQNAKQKHNIRIPPHRYCTSVSPPSMHSHKLNPKCQTMSQYYNIRIPHRQCTTVPITRTAKQCHNIRMPPLYHRPVCPPTITHKLTQNA